MNTNVLRNFRCPQCKQTDRLRVVATTVVTLIDDGEEDHTSTHWDDNSDATCPDCGVEGSASMFFVQPDELIREAALAFLHSEDPESIDLTALALALGEDPADVEAIQKDTKPRHVSFYASQDLPVDGGTWSVFREFYLTADHEEPIDDLTTHISTHPNEAEADAEVNRLYAEHQPCVAAGLHLPTQRHIRIECAAHPGKTYDHEAAPDSMPGPGETCKTCGEDITWNGPGQYDYLHVDDEQNR